MLEGELYTLVDVEGNPVYTDEGMDGYFALCSTFGDMMTFSHQIGWSQMMRLARWSQSNQSKARGRIAVYPAKVTIKVERIEIDD